MWDILYAKTLILKGYEERRYPSMNQACIEEKYKMPEQEEVEEEEEDSDEVEGTFEKASEWLESYIKNMNNWTENESDMKLLYNDIKTHIKLSKYIRGVNKKGQEMGSAYSYSTSGISTMKRKKVGYIYHLLNSQC